MRVAKGFMQKIAIIEDNPDNRLLAEAILQDFYAISQYASGREAFADFNENKPHLILLDISLPEMDGLQVLQKIRTENNWKKIPVIALTAHAMTGDRQKFLAAGFNDYVSKPILDDTVLLAVVAQWILRDEL